MFLSFKDTDRCHLLFYLWNFCLRKGLWPGMHHLFHTESSAANTEMLDKCGLLVVVLGNRCWGEYGRGS